MATTIKDLHEPVTVAECAEREAVNTTAVRYWIESGQVPAVRSRNGIVLDYSQVPHRPAVCRACKDCGEGFETRVPRRGPMPELCPDCKSERRRATWRRSYRRRIGRADA